jgi:hypothetical protein
LQLIPTIFTSDFSESKEKKQQWNAFKKRICLRKIRVFGGYKRAGKKFLSQFMTLLLRVKNSHIDGIRRRVWK